LVFLALLVLELFTMYATDRRTDGRTKATLNAPYPRGGGITTSATGALQRPDHVCGLWNTLPLNLRLCDSLGQFKQSLKTFLFGS